MKRSVGLFLLVTSAVRCDVATDGFNFASDIEQTYKKAKKHDDHCDRVAQAIAEVVTVKRCEVIVRDFVSANSQELQRTAGTILDDIRAKLSHEDKHKFGKIIKKVGSIFELLSRPDAESERVAVQLHAKALVLRQLVAPYIKACEKHVDGNRVGQEGKEVAQEIVQKLFSDLKTFCAEQQRLFEKE